MTSLITSLHQSLEITPLDNDQVQVTVVLPSDLLNSYQSLLESLAGFVSAINHQKHHQRLRAAADLSVKAVLSKADYHKRLVKSYDDYTASGLSRTDAIKRISADLSKEKHPWAGVDLVRKSLIEAGRSGRVGRPARRDRS